MADIDRRDPFQDLMRFWPRSFGGDWFRRLDVPTAVSDWNPSCDLTEQEGEYLIRAELPGVKAEDVDITLDDGVLRIRGEKKSETKEEKDGRTYSERSYGSFERAMTVAGVDDGATVDATLKDGVLELHIPRKPATKPEAKKIAVKTG
jgi:HSP20 family protein